MTVQIPMSYQPSVGESISETISGKVISVSMDPLVTPQILVTIDLDPVKAKSGWDKPVQVMGMPGES